MFIFEENDASNYLDMENEDLVVTNLLHKYNISISTQNSFLYNLNDDYKALIDFVTDLYLDEQEIPRDIQFELENNTHFKTYLLSVIKDKMNNILCDNSTIVFKEIVTVVNLLSFGKNYNIFENYNFYNLEKLGELFREYEKKLIDLKEKNKENFTITFNHYVSLIEVINELCTINSTDVLRKRTINPIIETLSETINIAKFNLPLDEMQINTLNNILGKLLFFYSHIPYINTDGKNAQYLIDEFTFNFEKLSDGYTLSKNTGFASDKNTQKYYKIFLNSTSTLISTLLYKLENTYKKEDYNDINKFSVIIELYNEMSEHIDEIEFNSIEELKEHFLDNYTYVYEDELKTDNYISILEHFLEDKDFNSSNMQILLSIILFTSDISEQKLIDVVKILLSIDKYENDYHEFYKLNLCDIIINRLSYMNSNVIKEELNEDIISYIETNKIASHLMSIYSKIYLSLSLYYSYYFDAKSNEYSKYYYYKYLSINGTNLLENEYKKINSEILLNLGERSINQMGLNNLHIDENKYFEIGTNLIKNYAEQFEITTKYNINQKLSNIVTDIFTNEGLDNDTLNHHIESFISKDIFHGLTFVSVEGLCEHRCRLIDIGYDKIQIPLLEGYTLRMAYSRVYKHIFSDIYEKNKEYIKQNIINLIVSYLKSIPIHFDSITRLKNVEKLQKELNDINKDDITFVEIYFENLTELNTKYTYAKANKIFRAFAQNVNNICTAYRLSGPKLGMIVCNEIDYKECIEKIRKIKIQYEDSIIEPKLAVAVSWGNSENIVIKSEHSMANALKSELKYNEFK